MKTSKDRFSDQASIYARFRPHYPEALYRLLADLCHTREMAWDAATGNGQVAIGLSPYFDSIYASDLSQQQISHAFDAPNVCYSVHPAEQPPYQNHSFDLITVAQAAHWLDLDRFYPQVDRLLKPGGILAIWGYHLFRTTAQVDRLLDEFYFEKMGPYWDPEVRHLQQRFRGLKFPYSKLDVPGFQLKRYWTLEAVEGYLNSWSAVRNYRLRHEDNPVVPFIDSIKLHFAEGNGLEGYTDLFLTACRKPD